MNYRCISLSIVSSLLRNIAACFGWNIKAGLNLTECFPEGPALMPMKVNRSWSNVQSSLRYI